MRAHYYTNSFQILLRQIPTNYSQPGVFLKSHPCELGNDQIFEELQATVVQLKVVNDAAERGIALIKAFNSAIITKKSKNIIC